jgi:LmbE family N-acetylglucosaminyl deacetylase
MSAEAPRTVLHFAPHPDDELLGAPAALMALRDAGFRVVNVACGLGSDEERERREAELRRAAELARFELFVPEEPAKLSSQDDRSGATAQLDRIVEEAIHRFEPRLVVSPSPHDRHTAHELVGRAVRDRLQAGSGEVRRWWMWGLWAELPLPTIGVRFDDHRLAEIGTALEAHVGELERNDYRRVLHGRAEMEASLGPELLFGFGSGGAESPYLELLTEVVLADGRWLLGRPRWLEGDPVAEPSRLDVTAWVDGPSVTDLFGPPGSQTREEEA